MENLSNFSVIVDKVKKIFSIALLTSAPLMRQLDEKTYQHNLL